MTEANEALSQGWFGYGGWSAKYWFVGMEPGGDEAISNTALWEQANKPAFMDISLRLPEQYDWFGPDSKTQHTWQKLIWLLLAYKNVEPTAANTVGYQRKLPDELGSEIALIELSPFAAESAGHEAPRDLGREGRIETIRTHLLDDKPEFVVFYSAGSDYIAAWNKIAGTSLTEGQPVLIGSTACVVTYHPNHEWGKAYWKTIAERLRRVKGD